MNRKYRIFMSTLENMVNVINMMTCPWREMMMDKMKSCRVAASSDGTIKWTRFNYTNLVDNHAGDTYNFKYPTDLAN